MSKNNFKKSLARVFDSDLRTKQWENIVDYVIIGLIVLSTLSIFMSTYELSPAWETVLQIVDTITVIVFTIEVTLRIWAADEIDPKYSGFWGRVRYCFTFYGFIDIVSTYSFYVAMVVPLPYSMLKALRVLRLLRIFRYMTSFRLLQRAVSSKANELFVSLQFLVVVTIMLSFVLFFYEHAAQPEVYNNGMKSVVWAFAQYIGDPGGFAGTPPITLMGRIIACIIGVLGIAIFAVPAGLIGSGFSEAMEDEKQSQKIKQNIQSIVRSFKFEKDQHYTQLFVVPRYKEVNTIITRKYIPYDDILEAVKESDCLHLYDLVNAANAVDNPKSSVVVINYKRNTPYGCCIDRGSRVTIVSTSSASEPATGWLAYHIAKLGGFNYISKDVETDPDSPTSYYNVPKSVSCPNFELFIEDLNRLTSRPDSWAIPVLGAIGPRTRPHQFHFCYAAKGDQSYDDTSSRVKDFETFDKLYTSMSQMLDQKYEYKCDKNIWYGVGRDNIANRIGATNVFTLRVECFVWVFDQRRVVVIKDVAEAIHNVLEPERELVMPSEMVARKEGHDYGMEDYVD